MVVALTPLTVLYYVIALVPGMLLHELAHGFLAVRLGDPTPRYQGRMTLNLRPHVDPFGTIVVPALLLLPVLFGRPAAPFGYMKPMPMSRQNLRNPDRHMIWIALAGIGANLALAVIGAALLRTARGAGPFWVQDFLGIWVFTNVLLSVFHIIPLPPLDGSRILAPLLPPRARQVYESWEPYGALFVLVILFLLPAPILGIVQVVVEGLLNVLLA